MPRIFFTSLCAIVVSTIGAAPAWALAGGGLAPGGPMSGTMRPACNGWNMDGTRNTSAGAKRAGCIDHSANTLKRPTGADRDVFR